MSYISHAAVLVCFIARHYCQPVNSLTSFLSAYQTRGQSNRGTLINITPPTHTHTHPFDGPFSGTTQVRWACTRKEKPIWILPKQETVSGSGISWAVCKSAPRSRQITMPLMPAPHYSFLQAGCPSCRPTNSVKALKAKHYSTKSMQNVKSCRIIASIRKYKSAGT